MRRALVIVLAAIGIATITFLVRERTLPRRDVDASAGPDAAAPQSGTLTALEASDSHPLPDVLIDPRLLVEKQRRALTVFSAGEVAKTYRIALGREPIGDKEREGDGRTPEGEFYICTRNEQSQYHRSLGISYPDIEDADRGREAGLITTREHRHISEAIKAYRQPPWNTALGGEIVIHGGGTHRDWTAGCIALDDSEAEELFDAIPLGTPVQITP